MELIGRATTTGALSAAQGECGRHKACGRNRFADAYKKMLPGILFFIMMALAGINAQAATATVSASTASAVTGNNVTVTVKVSSSEVIGGGDVYITYDTSILEFVSGTDVTNNGGGNLYWLAFDMSSSVSELSVTLTFKGLKAGTSVIGISSSTQVYDENANNITYTSSNGKVTVTTPSTDATLASLKLTGTTSSGTTQTISLTPSFSKNTTSYTATVSDSVQKVVTTASANSSKATVSISATTLTLKTGSNTITVKVTAESGATKTYTITITKKAAETTTKSETTKSETTTSETTTQEETSTEEETTPEETTPEEETTGEDETEEQESILCLTTDGEEKILLESFDEAMLPEGFEQTEMQYEGRLVQVGVGIYKDLTLYCLADADGSNPQLYIGREDGSFLLLRNIQTNARLYTILELPETKVPDGYRAVTLVLTTDYAADDEVDAWQKIANPDYYIIYAMNWDGTTGYYSYDSVEGTIQRSDIEIPSEDEEETADADSLAQATPSDATPSDATPADASTDEPSGEDSSGIWKYLCAALALAVILILIIWLCLRARRRKNPGDPDPHGPDPGEGAATETGAGTAGAATGIGSDAAGAVGAGKGAATETGAGIAGAATGIGSDAAGAILAGAAAPDQAAAKTGTAEETADEVIRDVFGEDLPQEDFSDFSMIDDILEELENKNEDE